MKGLFVRWEVDLMDIPWGLMELGEEVELYPAYVQMQVPRKEEEGILSNYLRENDYNFVITHNFSQTVSNACMENNVKYISWVFDSPQIHLYSQAAFNECNYIFVFDISQYERMKKRGFSHLFYLPLAANVSKISMLPISKEDEEAYSADITFVGSLYEKNHYNEEAGLFTKEIKESLDSIILKKSMHWEKGSKFFGSLTNTVAESLRAYVNPLKEYDVELPYFMELYYIARKVTEIERICILNGLAIQHQVDLYTNSEGYALENVRMHGKIGYEEAPKIYHYSKINLNMTMRSIETGVPQRVYDIMAAGGFVLSNYQEEMEELFVPDKEIVFFHSMEELIEKVHYYLKHEDIRKQIAINGYKRVKKDYSYPVALKKILELIK